MIQKGVVLPHPIKQIPKKKIQKKILEETKENINVGEEYCGNIGNRP